MALDKEMANFLAESCWDDVRVEMTKASLDKLTQTKAQLFISERLEQIKDEAPEWILMQAASALIDAIPLPVLPDLLQMALEKGVEAAKDKQIADAFKKVDEKFNPKPEMSTLDGAKDVKEGIDSFLKSYVEFSHNQDKFKKLNTTLKPKSAKDYRKLIRAYWALQRDYCALTYNAYIISKFLKNVNQTLLQMSDSWAQGKTALLQKIAAHAEKNVVGPHYLDKTPDLSKGTVVIDYKGAQLFVAVDKALADAKNKAFKELLSGKKEEILSAAALAGWIDTDPGQELKVIVHQKAMDPKKPKDLLTHIYVYVKTPKSTGVGKDGIHAVIQG